MMNLKPEERAEIKIGAWLLENGFEIYSNRKGVVTKILCCGVFNTKGEMKRPDMIAFDNRDYYVFEIKSGTGSSKATRDSRKIIKYYENFLNKKTRYFIKGNEITPKYFLVASLFSVDGHLFEDKEIITHTRSEEEARIKGVPQKEYSKTFSFARQIWDEWKPIKDKRFVLGTLLSDKLNGGSGKPAVFVQEYNFTKDRWLPPHRFYTIGYEQ